MATGELRDRVRERLVAPSRRWTALGGLALGRRGRAAARRRAAGRRSPSGGANLARALADFDAATIATTHGFCQEVLGGLGVVGDIERDVDVRRGRRRPAGEVVDDLYVRRFHKAGGAPFSRAEALQIARARIENPAAPARARGRDGRAAARCAAGWRTRPARRARARASAGRGVITYDDLLTRLATRWPTTVGGRRRLRDRYQVVLVDEFQDTDPIQWEILRARSAAAASRSC